MGDSRPDRRLRLMAAAEELFLERPYDEVSVADVAERAGVAYGLVAHYFGNKRGLFVQTACRLADQLHSTQNRLPLPAGDAAAQIREGISRHIDYVEPRAALYAAIMRGHLGADPQVRTLVEDLRWEAGRLLIVALGGELPPPPALRNAVRGWLSFFDRALLDWLDHRDLSRAELIRLATATLAASVRTASAIDGSITLDTAAIAALDR